MENNYHNKAQELIEDLSKNISIYDDMEIEEIIVKTKYYTNALKNAKSTYIRTVLELLDDASEYYTELYDYYSSNLYDVDNTSDSDING